MPMFISALWGGLIQLAGSLVGRVLLSLGLGFVEFQGVSALVSSVTDRATAALGGFESASYGTILQWAGFFQFDVHISIIISAIGVKIALNALGGTSIRRLLPKAA